MSLNVSPLRIPEVKLVTPKRFGDHRGFFSETYNRKAFQEAGIHADFCQDNHSLSATKGTLRGLHFQAPPSAQSKLVRVLRGAVIDVAVDARRASPSFGQWVKAELSAENGAQLFVPKGFLHGFLTIEPDTEVMYKVDAYYDREADHAVRWDDPDLGIDWGVDISQVVISEKDGAAQSWAELLSPF